MGAYDFKAAGAANRNKPRGAAAIAELVRARMQAVMESIGRPGIPAAASSSSPYWTPGQDYSAWIPPDVRALIAKVNGGSTAPSPDAASPASKRPDLPGRFLSGVFANSDGARPYRLYVPASYRAGQAMPLVVMLHGCTQSPEDFAAGTGMNEAAERRGFLVLYPAQTKSAHAQKCWNWYSEGDQGRGAGEPSIIAGMTLQIMSEYSVNPARVFAAGLSAGGAAAAILGAAYPDLYAAIGVHSGLACGSARDLPSALTAMRKGADGLPGGARRRPVRAIVFHGDKDATVNVRNGEAVVGQSAGSATLKTITQAGRVPGGRAYTRARHMDDLGRTIIEHWVVEDGPHAWSGGSSAGTYTDPLGPDATAEMLRFFMEEA